MATKARFAEKDIEALAPGKKHSLGLDRIYLEISRTGSSRSWLMRYWHNGKERWAGLGGWPDVKLAKARQLAQEMQEELRRGLDPIAERDRRRRADSTTGKTVKETLAAYREAHESAWRPNYVAAVVSLHNQINAALGEKLIASLTVDDVLGFLESPWRKTPARARKAQMLAALAWEYAAARGWADPNGQNPAAWSRLRHLLPKRERSAAPRNLRAMPYTDLPRFWTALGEREGAAAEAMRLVILSACRTSEVIKAAWDEIEDLDGPTPLWRIPPARMKAGREHVVPLVPEAVEVLKRQAKVRRGPWIFPSANAQKHLSGMALLKLLDRMEWRAATTTHGMRSAARSWMQDAAVDHHLAESLLAHTLDRTVGAYARSQLIERKRAVLLAWSACVTSSTPAPAAAGGEAETGNVVALDAAKKRRTRRTA